MRDVTKVHELFCVVRSDPFEVRLDKMFVIMVELVDQGGESLD